MQLKNSPDGYGAITKTFHWIMALIIIGMLCVGFYMTGLEQGAAKFRIYTLHKSFGITVLALVICRFCWHLISKKPGFLDTLKPWERIGATAVHYTLYALMIMMPLSGWVMSSAAGHPVHFFNTVDLPDLVAPNKPFAEVMSARHEQLAWILIAVVGLHVAAALKHFLIDKDKTLQRMLPIVLAIVMLASPASANDYKWVYVRGESTLGFSASQTGTTFRGTFERFVPEIVFNPDDLTNAKVNVEIDLASVNTGSFERDDNLKGKDWFNTIAFPTARFVTTAIRRIEGNRYEADANLTIRDVTLPIRFVFTLDITESKQDPNLSTAVVDGSVTLDRSQFQLGAGSWADTSVIANEVPVTVHLVARNYKVTPP